MSYALKLRRYSAWLSLLCLLSMAWGGVRVWSKLQRDKLCEEEYETLPTGMVFVPAGEFWMGSDDANAEADERPLRKVFLPAFFIDRFEVTNRRYKEFKKTHLYPAGEEDFPVTFVLKRDAEAYCRWAGRRLPTSAEWEKAARGVDGRVFPWGNEFRGGLANINRRSGDTNGLSCRLPNATSPSKGKLPVGSFPKSVSPYGCHDMAGNVWEWVSDVWPDRDALGMKVSGEAKGILRGGASSYSPAHARTSHQGFEALEATCHDVGFRCSVDAVPAKR